MKRIAAAIVGVGLAIAIPATASAKTCSSSYTPAVISGKSVCLRGGEYCARAEARKYRKYGYVCEDVKGTYRLEQKR